jgi:predicted metal-binding membrane protein
MTDEAAVVRMLRRDRTVVVGALVGAVVLAWAYLLLVAGPNASMSAMGEPMMPMPWTAATFGVMALMWIAMMAAMMLPSAAPMILLFAAIDRKRTESGSLIGATSLFTFAYLVVWAAFSIAATSAQWSLQQARLLSPAMATASTALAGALLLVAGVYQLTPPKQACLRHCRSPLDFLTRYWRKGALGALQMGLRHGLFCLGCCWALMALLFVGGVMNMFWVAALALFVLVEKIVPGGRLLGYAGGVGLILWGGTILLAAVA